MASIYVTENQSLLCAKPVFKTTKVNSLNQQNLNTKIRVQDLITILEQFNHNNRDLFQAKRADLYNTFFIPKSNGGLRRIDAPNPEISEALKYLKATFETYFTTYAHDSAYAYVKGRCTVDAVKRHQSNQSKWFLKLDFTNFFGNSSYNFVVYALSKVFPFSEVLNNKAGKLALEQALELCFLNGSLPQGSPISPYLTNVMMIPTDYEIDEMLKRISSGKNRRFVYTRYADDMLISCNDGFKTEKIENELNKILVWQKAPFGINPDKTRYGSSAGQNWNLGVMLNSDNQITVGHQKKRQFKAMLDNYIRHHDNWELHDVQVLCGHLNYYHMIESDYIDHVIDTYNAKHKVDIRKMMHDDLSVASKI